MSRIPCPVDGCDLPARSGMPSGACEAELARALAAGPDVTADLDVTLSRQTSRAAGGRTSAIPLPYDARASEAGWVLRSALTGWVRQLQEAQPEPWPADTAASMAAWLSARLSRLIRHPAATEAHGEITAAVRGAQRVTDRPAERQFAGRCPACGEALYAKPGASRVQCRRDGCRADAVDVATQRDAMLGRLADQLMPAHQAADVLTRLAAPLSAATVRQWAKRGRITPHGHDAAGHPLYRVSDVRELLVEKLQREQQARAKREMMTA